VTPRSPSAASAVLTLLLLSSCVPSNVVAVADRAVRQPLDSVVWSEADRARIPGFYESERITGEAAGGILRVWYFFCEDGRYTGAALVLDGEAPSFQVLSGKWVLHEGRLSLDGSGEAAHVQVAEDRLLISSPTGSVHLRRVVLQ
jgi:hypothetical protein